MDSEPAISFGCIDMADDKRDITDDTFSAGQGYVLEQPYNLFFFLDWLRHRLVF